MICHQCQQDNRPQARFCARCGWLLGDHCPRCHNQVARPANYCDHCGLPLGPPGYPGWSVAGTPADVAAQPEVAPGLTATQKAPAAGRPAGTTASPVSDSAPASAPVAPSAAPSPTLLASPAPPAATSRLQKYIPPALLQKLNATQAGGGLAGERRIVTMLFCDVKGSTQAAAELDPEEWTEIINGAFEYMIRPVYHYEGTVARLMGDGILAFFGAPMAHEDDPERAILAALEMVAGIKAYREPVRQRWGVDLDVRVGINTGMVVVGAVGSDLRLEYTAIGDAINLAARMEQTALPGTVQVAEDTYRLVTNLFDFYELGEIEVRGRPEPVRAYRVLARIAQRGRLRGGPGLDAPLIGREAEMAALRQALEQLRQGVGGIVCLLGEAGLGKSRLAQELRAEALTGDPAVRWYETAGLSYESTSPYSLFQRLFRWLSGLSRDDPPEVGLEKLGRFLTDIGLSEPGPVMALKHLMGLLSSNGLSGAGEDLKRQIFAAVGDALQQLTTTGPIVLLFDDLQWADPTSIELLKDLFRLADESPVLFICLARPDRETPAWELPHAAETAYPHRLTQITLKVLTEADGYRLFDGLLDRPAVPARIRERIVQKAEGNPLVLEEIVQMLIDTGILAPANEGMIWRGDPGQADSIRLPGSLQTLLTARIDRLDDEVRRTLQLASVMGRRFYFRVLEYLCERSPVLEEHLGKLQRVDIIREAARLPELEYLFRHALTQEVTYSTILHKERRDYHRRVGEALETVFADQLDDLAPVLARHFLEGRRPERAVFYFERAGDAAFRLYASPEAIAHYQQALDIALQLPEVEGERIKHLFTRLGRALELEGRFDEALARYESMEQTARDRGDRPLELAALNLQGKLRSIVSPLYNPALGEALAERALGLARELGDREAEVSILWNLLNLTRFDQSRIEASVVFAEEALQLARELNLDEQRAYILNDMADALGSIGRIAEAQERLQEAEGLWRALDNKPMLADSLTNRALWFTTSGDFQQALRYYGESAAIARSVANAWGEGYSRGFSALVYRDIGQTATAIAELEAAIQLAEQGGFLVGQVMYHVFLALQHLDLGANERGLELARRSVVLGQERFPQWLRTCHSALIVALLQNGGLTEAREQAAAMSAGRADWINNGMGGFGLARLALADSQPEAALQEAQRLRQELANARSWIPETMWLEGQALVALDKREAARAALGQAYELAAELGHRRMLWRIAILLATVEPDDARAAALQAEARQVVLYILEHTPAELQGYFRTVPEVQLLLAEQAEIED